MRVLVVDDNEVVRAGLGAVLTSIESCEVVEAADGVDALAQLQQSQFDLALLDVRMPRKDGLAVLREFDGSVPIVMLTHSDDRDIVREALASGARGFLVHGTITSQEVVSAVHTCVSGGLVLSPTAAEVMLSPAEHADPGRRDTLGLTPREIELMSLLCDGLSNRDIAGRLFLSEKTIKNHLNRIYAKLAVANRGAAIVAWLGRD
ncbi:response regulator transcription factor [Luteipulveratus halotolerans]|uniref:LuxR family transcriptional regulator n=1 Tax=Luteipulveratus halotolerans TaxID=1631356 RepID=A0A0L6CKM9_9MICO|nr:response regulator transcription factor [Luteipulveratus halotolerans]KNX38351.1 hypothetical protein VV01_16280 [Luteipulveratus halotolerans]